MTMAGGSVDVLEDRLRRCLLQPLGEWEGRQEEQVRRGSAGSRQFCFFEREFIRIEEWG